MKKIIYLFAFVTVVLFSSCEENIETSDLNFINFAKESEVVRIDEGSTLNYEVTVFTTNTSSSDRSFKVKVNSDATTGSNNTYQLPETVTVPGGTNKGTFNVNFSEPNLGVSRYKLGIEFEGEEGLSIGGKTELEYYQCTTEVALTLDLVFHDNWPQEAAWEVTDSDGTVIASAPVGKYRGRTSATETFTACAGRAYTFKMIDDYGDGGHTFTLSSGSNVLASIAGPYSYTSSVSVPFTAN